MTSKTSKPKSETPSDLFLTVLEGHRQWPNLKTICDRLTGAGFDAVLAGGSVRDSLLGVRPKDFDIATTATPDTVEKLFEKTVAVGKSFGVIVVLNPDGTSIEVATYRQDGSYEDGRRPTGVVFTDREEDAKRRDFTVNALFYDPAAREIIDYADGLKDLEEKTLRAVGEPAKRFEEDKLRMLRAVRFSGQLDFEIEPETAKAIKLHAKSLKQVSRERIRDEVDKLLMCENPLKGFRAIEDLDLKESVFEDWAPWIFPVHPRVFTGDDLDVRRALLFYPALKRAGLDRIQERLKNWKYGRNFTELATWLMKNESSLRTQTEDLVREIATRQTVLERFQINEQLGEEKLEEREHTQAERDWMTSLELWTDERAIKAVEILDVLHGADQKREPALLRRGLTLGLPSGARAKAEDLKRDGIELSGPRVGRELRRLNRKILLGKI